MKISILIRIISAALLVFILNMAGHFLYMVIYSYAINPGQEFVAYQQHALASGPYVSFIIGFPAMLLVCRWVSKRAPETHVLVAALLVASVYVVVDLSILLYLKEYSSILLLFAISYIPYFVAAYVGASAANQAKGSGANNVLVL